jgi:hypothetical protein
MQALTEAMIVKMLAAAAVAGRERPETDAARISASVMTVATKARDQHRGDDAGVLELADGAMALLDAHDDALDGAGGEQG